MTYSPWQCVGGDFWEVRMYDLARPRSGTLRASWTGGVANFVLRLSEKGFE